MGCRAGRGADFLGGAEAGQGQGAAWLGLARFTAEGLSEGEDKRGRLGRGGYLGCTERAETSRRSVGASEASKRKRGSATTSD